MREIAGILSDTIRSSIELLNSLEALVAPLARGSDELAAALGAGRKLLICGNGGSAADAAHLATEFVVRFMTDRAAYPAICLSNDAPTLTAAGNDYGFDEVFARQVAAFGREGDILICLTTSGNSRNVQRALEEGRTRGLTTIALLGGDGGAARGTADIELIVRSESTARIQEAHMLLLHVLCEAVEERLVSQ